MSGSLREPQMSRAGATAAMGTVTRGGCDPWNTLRGEPPHRFLQGNRLGRAIAECGALEDVGLGRVARFLIIR